MDSDINDLWLGQGDALRKWDEHRREKDVAVVLNTGAGKTLVGLLIAQSLVNETKRQVVYACSSIQLLKQTATMARGYGLPVTTYYQQGFSDDALYHSAEAPCITTYQALFNGKTRFRYDDISAAVFDDAHTAEHILREQFSLTMRRSELPDIYKDIVALFLPYHRNVGMASSYAELIGQSSSRVFLVPPFEARRNIVELRRLLVQANLGDVLSTMFSWEHIRDHEDLCCILISSREITLTPPYVPVSTLPYFDDDVRRVYLSATLSTSDSFVRAFGRQPTRFVAPTTTAGECERMILTPSASTGVTDDLSAAKAILQDRKALILVPSFLRANQWADVAKPPGPKQAPEAVETFRKSSAPEKLILAARYDGIDLPGDTCRMLVLDELPKGSGPLETFLWERLNMRNSLRSMLATRIVQSFGRISRGMSDHGVVLLTGNGLVDWLHLPSNRSLLPTFLQYQLEIGQRISRQAAGTQDLLSATRACLCRDPNWVHSYTHYMRELPSDRNSDDLDNALKNSDDLDNALKIALAEARFGEAFWQREFHRAAYVLNDIVQEAFDFSQYTGAWLLLWLGFALEMDGDDESASHSYRKACATSPNIPRPIRTTSATAASVPQQVINIAEQMRIGRSPSISIQTPKTIARDLMALSGSGTVRQMEEALRCLGQYLGLDSTRPDNEFGRGPDVLWLDETGYAVCMEVKTCKQNASFYRKADAGQLHNHVQWVNDNHQVSKIVPMFVGPLLPASDDASPSPDMKVIELEQFEDLGHKLVSALEDAATQAMPSSLSNALTEVLRNRGLLYPGVLLSLDMGVLQDIPQSS